MVLGQPDGAELRAGLLIGREEQGQIHRRPIAAVHHGLGHEEAGDQRLLVVLHAAAVELAVADEGGEGVGKGGGGTPPAVAAEAGSGEGRGPGFELWVGWGGTPS